MYFFCNRVLSYFAKPNFIVYDEWFDNDFQKNKLDVKNKKIKTISNMHEFFYELIEKFMHIGNSFYFFIFNIKFIFLKIIIKPFVINYKVWFSKIRQDSITKKVH